MNNNLKTFLEGVFKNLDIYFYTIDNLFNKIVIFSGWYILEVSIINRWCEVKKSNLLFFNFRKFDDISKIYNFVNDDNDIIKNNKDIASIVNVILKYDKEIHRLFIEQNSIFYNDTFKKVQTNKKVLLILRWWWMEETIEKSFISYCNYSNIELTVLYKFWTWYWWQKINQDWFFNELKVNNKNVKFDYKEDFDDAYIDSIIDKNTEVFSFQYDYEWKYNNLNLIVLSSVVDNKDIDCSKYKNIFSSYESESIWYSTDSFINTSNTNIYKIFNGQNIDILKNYTINKQIDSFFLSWWMEWARDFWIINSLEWKHKWIMISDENHNIRNFLDMYRWIQSYYWFLGVFKLSSIFIACHLDEFNDDDRSKMIATSICSWIPVLIPYNEWKIVKTVIDNKLWLTYINWDENDFKKQINKLNNKELLKEYSNNCMKYSEKNMDINKFINFIFNTIL